MFFDFGVRMAFSVKLTEKVFSNPRFFLRYTLVTRVVGALVSEHWSLVLLRYLCRVRVRLPVKHFTVGSEIPSTRTCVIE